MILRECKRPAEMDFSSAVVSTRSAREQSMAGMEIEMMLASTGGVEATKAIEEGQKLFAKAKENGEDGQAITRRVMAEAAKKQIDSMKSSYAKQASELAEKRLQLDAVEKQYLKAE